MAAGAEAMRRSDLAWYLGITAATGTAFAIGTSPLVGVLAAAGMLGLTAVLAGSRRRSDAARVIGGGGDERNQALYERALAWSGGLLGLVTTAWFLLSVARGETDAVLLTLTVLFAASFVGSAAYTSWRS